MPFESRNVKCLRFRYHQPCDDKDSYVYVTEWFDGEGVDVCLIDGDGHTQLLALSLDERQALIAALTGFDVARGNNG